MHRMIGGLLAALALVALVPSATAEDDNGCTIDIKHDIRVSAERLSVAAGDESLYDIEQGGALAVRGQPVELSSDQRALVENYAGELSALIPQVIELVSSALALAGSSVSAAFREAFGEDSSSGDKLAAALDEARLAFEARAKPEPGVYVLAESQDEFGDELEEEMDTLVGEAMAEVMSEIGRALTSGEGSFLERMEAFGEGMEAVGREIEQSSDVVADWSEEVCANVERVRELEREVQRQVPAFSGLGVLGDG